MVHWTPVAGAPLGTKLMATETFPPGAPDPPDSESEGVCAQAPPPATAKTQIRTIFPCMTRLCSQLCPPVFWHHRRARLLVESNDAKLIDHDIFAGYVYQRVRVPRSIVRSDERMRTNERPVTGLL